MRGDLQLSACIVLYHSGAATMETVRSVMASDIPVDLFIVDNSPDQPTGPAIVRAFPGIHYHKQTKNEGFGKAHNYYLQNLRSTYHLILNPDVTFEPDLLRRMVDYMDKHEDISVLTPRVFNTDGTEQFLPRRRPSVRYMLSRPLEKRFKLCAKWRAEYTMKDREVTVPMRVEFATGCFMLVRTHFLQRLNGFDERFFLYHEDSDLSRRMQELGPIVYHPDMTITHHWKRESAHSFKARWIHIKSTIRYFRKWGWKW